MRTNEFSIPQHVSSVNYNLKDSETCNFLKMFLLWGSSPAVDLDRLDMILLSSQLLSQQYDRENFTVATAMIVMKMIKIQLVS